MTNRKQHTDSTSRHSNVYLLTVGVLLAIVVAAFITIVVMTKTVNTPDATNAIRSFSACAEAGYPILETYPEQCSVPGVGTFTKIYE